MTPTQEQALKDAMKQIDWQKFIKWGTVTVHVAEGKPMWVEVNETVRLALKEEEQKKRRF